MDDLLIIVLAAGKGTRMNSSRNKMLHGLAGRPLIKHVVDTSRELTDDIVCVVGHQAEKVRGAAGEEVEFVFQEDQQGTGHAVWQAEEYIRSHSGDTLVLYGDTPLVTAETLKDYINNHRRRQAGMSILTAELDDPAGYGRILRDESGSIMDIVEEHDCRGEEAQIKEINAGIYCFASQLLHEALKQIDNDNAQNEYYLTDCLYYIKEKAELASAEGDPAEIIGINDRSDLAAAEKVMQRRIKSAHLDRGVTLIDPERTYIEKRVEIGRDTTIYPGVTLRGETRIGRECLLEPGCQLKDARLAEKVNVLQGSVIRKSRIERETSVGPYAYIRPGCSIARGCKIGDFVELKKASVGEGSKVPHLTYVGDAEIGSGCNVGAGTVFANYDGENKHKTVLGDGVFVGSNTTLVAPLKLEDGAKTGAGSVVVDDVKSKTTVLGVPARFYKRED
ncbi:bifunctional UDP-N-acetylglucosamine diphosphorylase/glucosamine-1-phosphate N-acetyltransferase GlmU [Halarsenatibacter silvermanii]|uniref:Bifunctional protein GlmU n=1 Tax=Halarsenatibacter silvermanii TaxID=321763 RepID=A0A1G9QDP0_9FIRM|nr:bifunctional UDP-N-acetylglucosamine diphosphorylase/glucosamine-1-phosphate N-acetyltransferase GlmU [Halarsenatibacter silvermanii]SDM09119.1 UDP-N-acetylglucosamine pyrophosphorylase /glucosamine-1-phosphate N-acetyltransferase [Halarsenatibacter silvermanii]